ncbi:hypothetical protein BAUCODRAFT_32410 [Baudoinia panamericana UAMH 10762]|uniref:Uncharacterized protein n=1 Tax=Baudoinia panamericana (strain UAMH 10762) TaxID=717646 RepID=M2N345_BAUPA|nr:uncharacterized protein BAUCODRAFT_32410 [Baudoinia panamericana UAMH 10762]EMC98378.1 hypothetical protein BAUCODRAFT_32410 [Baudoinia panamericana UAMH 10762]
MMHGGVAGKRCCNLQTAWTLFDSYAMVAWPKGDCLCENVVSVLLGPWSADVRVLSL